VGETLANIRRYYHDHQLYINRVPKDISPKEVSKYFSNFGTVLNVVLLPSLKTNEKYMHCYIKFEQSKSVDKVLLVRKLELAGREIRALRTFRIGESESTDKRLEVIIEPIPESIEVLENHINVRVYPCSNTSKLWLNSEKELDWRPISEFAGVSLLSLLKKKQLEYWQISIQKLSIRVFMPVARSN
jgi:RNA recognition motif-containing protein